MAQPGTRITININELHVHHDARLEPIMGQIEDLQASFDALDTAVRTFLGSQTETIDALNAEIDALVADDEIENSKLEGLRAAADKLTEDVTAFSPPEATQLPAEPPAEGEAPVEEPVDPDFTPPPPPEEQTV